MRKNLKIKDLVYYDPSSPSGLRWKIDRFNGSVMISQIGDVAGYIDVKGYYYLKNDDNVYRAHRLVYELVTGTIIPEGLQIDHIDRNKTPMVQDIQIHTERK
jgi:hypothetical protein